MSWSKSQARVLARTLQKDGADYDGIRTGLAAHGILGVRSGKPLSNSQIAFLLGTHGSRPQAKTVAATKVIRKVTRNDRVEAVRSILSLKMDAEERIALAMLVLG